MKIRRGLIAPIIGCLLFSLKASAQTQTISAPETVSETRISRTMFEYVMRAKLNNPGPLPLR